MLYSNTLSEIKNNLNTGVEYEISLFYSLLSNHPDQQDKVLAAIKERADSEKILSIISRTHIQSITNLLSEYRLSLKDCSFETQNDDIGPSDLVMTVNDKNGASRQIGISVKYANTCTLNVTGRNFISDQQITDLKALLPQYTKMYIDEMTRLYGNVNNWFRQRKLSTTTDQYIDLIRDAVIANWKNVPDKANLLSTLFHSNSPIEFWVFTYANSGHTLRTRPQTIDMCRAEDVTVGKFQTSYIAFYLDGRMVGHMQVKFNNGFVERCKKLRPDFVCQGIEMAYGQPFSSWNFSVEK